MLPLNNLHVSNLFLGGSNDSLTSFLLRIESSSSSSAGFRFFRSSSRKYITFSVLWLVSGGKRDQYLIYQNPINFQFSLLWIQKLLNKFFSILEASKRTNRIKNVSIYSRYCRNNVSLDNFHHRQFKLEFTLSTRRHPRMAVDFC